MIKTILVASLLVSGALALPAASPQACTSVRQPTAKYLTHGNLRLTPNEATAVELLDRLFTLHDGEAVNIYAENFIQRNPTGKNGRAGMQEVYDLFVKDNAALKYDTGFVFSNGNIVGVHGVVHGFGPVPVAAFDFYRIECGLIAEHWDMLFPALPDSQLPPGNLPAFTLGEQNTMGREGKERANILFTNATLSQLVYKKDLSIIDKFVAENIVQHTAVPSGREALKSVFASLTSGEIGFIVAKGEMVAVHARWVTGGVSNIATEIFRIKGGKFVERWAVSQPEVPASQSVSGNSMFDRNDVNLIRPF